MTSPAEPQRPPRQQPLGDLRARGREMRARQQEQKAARSAPAPAVPDWRQTARSTPPPSGVPGREEQAARSELPPEPELPDPFGADLDAVLPDSLDGIDWGPAGPPGRKTGSGHGGWAASRRRAGPSVSDPRPRQLAEIQAPDDAPAPPGTLTPGPGGFVTAQGRARQPAAARPGGRGKGAERRQRTGPGRLVRPYMVSGGRTSSDTLALEMEALIVTTSFGEASLRALARERRQITELCRDVLSVAEISAHLDVPFGVACVLVGDLAGEGMVQVHRPASPDARPDLALLERVLYGLRDL